jgi:hypothetical protein
MTAITSTLGISWRCRHTWRRASYNTSWCLLGCAIGDLGTILFFQVTGIPWPVWAIMSLAIMNGLLTSIALETVPIMLLAGFLAPLPYNYWRLKALGKACH